MEVLERITDNPACVRRERVFKELYEKAFRPFSRFAGRMHAPFQDARDIFHDALVIYYEKTLEEDFSPDISAEAYIVGIAKHLWIKKFKHDRNRISLDSLESGIRIPDDYFPSVNETRLLRFLEATGKKCLDLLRHFYYEKMNMKEVAARWGYHNERSAAVGKFKCIEKMRNAIRTNSIRYEDFLE